MIATASVGASTAAERLGASVFTGRRLVAAAGLLRRFRDTWPMDVDLLPFLAISVLLILIPGPDTAVVTKNALLGGRRSGVSAAVGVSVGLTIWTIAAAFGLAALLQASSVAFLVLKLVGAAYLI